MQAFQYQDHELFCEGVPVSDIVRKVGSPVYVYSRQRLISNFKAVEAGLSAKDHLVCYALKANGNLNILKVFADMGCGADVVSGGELSLALKTGIPPEKIVFAGVGKTDDEIELAARHRILSINVESFAEISIINQIAVGLRTTIPVAIRINPDIEIESHPYQKTGIEQSKFGIVMNRVEEAFQTAASLPGIRCEGIHCHIGSMIMNAEPYIRATEVMARLVRSLRMQGISIGHVDIGGGLGLDYSRIVDDGLTADEEKAALTPADLFRSIFPVLDGLGVRLLFEPGRYLVADAGALVTRVTLVKKNNERKFVVVDAGMNDLIRPSLYDSYHQIVVVNQTDHDMETVHVVGPICESGDFFAHDRSLPRVNRGDLLAVMAAGAYGYSLSSNYNGRLRAPEVLVEGNSFRLIRERERIDDLWRGIL